MSRPICVQKKRIFPGSESDWVMCVVDANEILLVVGHEPYGEETGCCVHLRTGQVLEVRESVGEMFEMLSPIRKEGLK